MRFIRICVTYVHVRAYHQRIIRSRRMLTLSCAGFSSFLDRRPAPAPAAPFHDDARSHSLTQRRAIPRTHARRAAIRSRCARGQQFVHDPTAFRSCFSRGSCRTPSRCILQVCISLPLSGPSRWCENRATSSASLRPGPFGIDVMAHVGGECRKCASSPGRACQSARYHVDGDHHGRSGLSRCTPVDQRLPFDISRRQH